KSYYTRQLLNGHIFHNNRCDNIKKIIYKDKLIAQKQSDSETHLKINMQKELDFPIDSEVDIDSFKILELLGKGSFGEVYLVELIKTKKRYAMKVLNKSK